MKIPRLTIPFICDRATTVVCTVRIGRERWRLYLNRGPRFTILRATHCAKPWLVVRFAGSTDSWDRGSYGEREDFLVSFLRKLSRPVQGSVDRPDASDPKLASKFPALLEHITCSKGSDGAARQTCSLTIFGAPGGFRAYLNDRDSGAAIMVSADRFEGILSALEAELQSESPSWFWRPENGNGKGKKRPGSA